MISVKFKHEISRLFSISSLILLLWPLQRGGFITEMYIMLLWINVPVILNREHKHQDIINIFAILIFHSLGKKQRKEGKNLSPS